MKPVWTFAISNVYSLKIIKAYDWVSHGLKIKINNKDDPSGEYEDIWYIYYIYGKNKKMWEI